MVAVARPLSEKPTRRLTTPAGVSLVTAEMRRA